MNRRQFLGALAALPYFVKNLPALTPAEEAMTFTINGKWGE